MKEIKLIINYNGNFAGETVKVSESAATELIDMGFAQEPEAGETQEPEVGEMQEPGAGAQDQKAEAPEAPPTNKAIQPEYKSRKPKK